MRVCSDETCGRDVYAQGLCGKHYQRARSAGLLTLNPMKSLPTNEARFWAYAQPNRYGCWAWTGSINPLGYGSLRLIEKRNKAAHLFAYELLIGPVPDGLVLDHLCQNRACCNPHHLEPVTRWENTRRGRNHIAANARKTHCMRGHALSGENVRVGARGRRSCRQCERELRKARIEVA
jgi:phage terminase large subunit-like protein